MELGADVASVRQAAQRFISCSEDLSSAARYAEQASWSVGDRFWNERTSLRRSAQHLREHAGVLKDLAWRMDHNANDQERISGDRRGLAAVPSAAGFGIGMGGSEPLIRGLPRKKAPAPSGASPFNIGAGFPQRKKAVGSSQTPIWTDFATEMEKRVEFGGKAIKGLRALDRAYEESTAFSSGAKEPS